MSLIFDALADGGNIRAGGYIVVNQGTLHQPVIDSTGLAGWTDPVLSAN